MLPACSVCQWLRAQFPQVPISRCLLQAGLILFLTASLLSLERPVCCQNLAVTTFQKPVLVSQGGHSKPITQSQFSFDNKTFVTCSIDGTVKNWDIATSSLLSSQHFQPPVFLYRPQNSQFLILRSGQGRFYQLSFRRGVALEVSSPGTEEHPNYSINPRNEWLLGTTIIESSRGASSTGYNVFDSYSGKKIGFLPFPGPLLSLTHHWISSNLQEARLIGHRISFTDDNFIQLLPEMDLWERRNSKWRKVNFTLDAKHILDAKFSEHGKVLFTVEAKPNGNELIVRDTTKYSIQKTIRLSALIDHGTQILSISSTQKGGRVAVGDNASVDARHACFCIINLEKVKVEKVYKGSFLSFSADGSRMAKLNAALYAEISDVQSMRTVGRLRTQTGYGVSLGSSSDKETVWVGTDHAAVEKWNIQTGRLEAIQALRNAPKFWIAPGASSSTEVYVSPQGEWAAMCRGYEIPQFEGPGGEEICLWKSDGNRANIRINDYQHGFWPRGRPLFSDNGSILVTGLQEAVERVEMQKIGFRILPFDIRNKAALSYIYPNKAETETTFSPIERGNIALSPNGELIALGQTSYGIDNKGVVTIHELKSGKTIKTLDYITSHNNDRTLHSYIKCVAFDPTGRIIASLRSQAAILEEGKSDIRYEYSIDVWDVDSGQIIRKIDLDASAYFDRMMFSPSGKHLVGIVGQEWTIGNCELKVIDIETRRLRELTSNCPKCTDIKFVSSDIMVSAHEDGSLRMWNVERGRLTATLLNLTPVLRTQSSSPDWLIFTPEGYYTCSEGADYLIKWRFKDRLVPFSDFEETYRRPDLVRKALRGEVITEKPLTLSNVSPLCQFIQPKEGTAIRGNVAHVQIEATDDRDVEKIEIYVNGVRVPEHLARPLRAGSRPLRAGSRPLRAGSREVPNEHKVSRIFTADVPLPAGEREILLRAVVHDNERLKSDASIKIRRANVKSRLGNLYLLSVGVSQYRNPKYNLNYAAKDARVLAELIKTQQGKQYAQVHASVLTNEQATTTNICASLQRIKAQAKSSDTIIIFLAGHGVREAGQFYFAPHGVVVNDVEGTCLPWGEVLDTLSGVYAKKILFADACHSGAKLGERQASSEHLVEATRRSGMVLLASSSGDEYSFESKEYGHGAFTVALLEALRGKADVDKNQSVTVPELELYVPQRVSALTNNRQHPHVVAKDFNPQTSLARVK